MAQSSKDVSAVVIEDLANAVAAGLNMLPKFPRRWLCKYGDIKTDAPTFSKSTPENREIFKKLKSEYLEMLEQAQGVEIKTSPRERYAGIPLNLK
ncbi:hypothetical protein [Vibrio harveyi]|uniref:hypothetical protein n=1 Tax=Vibrio harveyi TaxID=669 RepID=UPI003CF829FE